MPRLDINSDQNLQILNHNPVVDRKTHLSALIKNLPNLPGVYKMLGKNGDILYIGKAKSLKNRVGSYFAKTHDHPKTSALVARIWDIEVIVVRGETEALLLEQNLIKAHRPPYNVMLRDDKSYLYVYISNDKFPKIAVGRGKANHSAGRFFGPYPSAHNAKEIILLIQKMFMLRTCKNSDFATRKRPCLEYQIKRCSAPCVGLISSDDYIDSTNDALAFLKGQASDVKDALKTKMQTYADNMQFELAAFYRDRLVMINEIQARQAVYKTQGEADVMAIGKKAGVICVHILTVRQGQVLGGKNYFIDDVASDDDLAHSLSRFVMSFYREISDDVPSQIITSEKLPDQNPIACVLSQSANKKVVVKSSVREHRKEWLDIALLNVKNALNSKLSDYNELQIRLNALNDTLRQVTDRPIDRIECFDISHTMGEATIASCVVCDSGGLRRRDYRQYAIHGIEGGDDYAAMSQAITRRYSKNPLPDVLLIDGGKGQLNTAKQALLALDKLNDTLLIGVAKGEGRKAGLEVLHFIDHDPLDLPTDNKALHLIMHIRDEAHRFAITAHRKKRDKARSSSILEVIPGLGAKRRRDLLSHFGGMGQLLSASQDEIAGVKGIGKVLANTIYKALHA